MNYLVHAATMTPIAALVLNWNAKVGTALSL